MVHSRLPSLSMTSRWWSSKAQTHLLFSGRLLKQSSYIAQLLNAIGTVMAVSLPVEAADEMVLHRNRVPVPTLIVTPTAIVAKPYEHVKLTAMPKGGEARIFTVRWRLVEGMSGGRLTVNNKRQEDGSYLADFMATQAGNTFRIVVNLNEFPSTKKEINIDIEK